MKIALIAAMSENRVIGIDNQLPWHLPLDLQHFKQLTLGKPMIMGRLTFLSIGRALPGRTSIVITQDPSIAYPDCLMASSFEAALKLAADFEEVMIIGGERLFQTALPLADTLHLTLIGSEIQGDRYFPEFNWDDWEILLEEHHEKDPKHAFNFKFMTLKRKRK